MNGTLAWVIQESPNLIMILVCLFYFTPHTWSNSLANQILVGLFAIHYIQRTLIFPFLIKGGKPSTFLVFLFALIFCAFNGYIQIRYLTNFSPLTSKDVYNLHFIVGSLLFCLGMAINIHSDHILRNLRAPGETGYKIPKGGLFNYVSGANFFGEILEWLGFAIACNSLTGLAFFLSTLCNIGPRALHHHYWYRNKFKDEYPKDRKALIPYVL